MSSDNDYTEVLERVRKLLLKSICITEEAFQTVRTSLKDRVLRDAKKYKRFEKLENCVYNHLSYIKDSTTMAEVMDMAGDILGKAYDILYPEPSGCELEAHFWKDTKVRFLDSHEAFKFGLYFQKKSGVLTVLDDLFICLVEAYCKETQDVFDATVLRIETILSARGYERMRGIFSEFVNEYRREKAQSQWEDQNSRQCCNECRSVCPEL